MLGVDIAVLGTMIGIMAALLKGVSHISNTASRGAVTMERMNILLESLKNDITELKEYDRGIQRRVDDIENWLTKHTEFTRR